MAAEGRALVTVAAGLVLVLAVLALATVPLSVAALVSGMMTLVATAPNLVVHGELLREGHAGFAFFDFLPFGAPVLALAIGYMLFARRWLGGGAPVPSPRAPRLQDWIGEYRLEGRAFRVRVARPSPECGTRVRR